MGTAMATRLMATGHSPVGWNRSPRPVEGVRGVDALAQLTSCCDVVITSLHDGAAVESVYLGHNGLCQLDLRGKLLIDVTTVTPQISRRIAARVIERGGSFADAPVLGTIGPCLRGELIAMVGASDRTFGEASTALKPLTRAVHHLGPVGAGNAAKLAVNLVMGGYWASLRDALKLASAFSIDQRQLLDIIASGPAALAQMPSKRPILEGEARPVEFSVSGYIKDLKTILEAAGPQLPLATVIGALSNYEEAVAAGLGASDVVAVALLDNTTH
jgi:3-hydroxyisobutyrate dehydrogenase